MPPHKNDRRSFLKSTGASFVGIAAVSCAVEGISASAYDSRSNSISCSPVSVKEYGAVGNGQVNDAPAINQAINENNYVCFPKGCYLLEESLVINRNGVHLEGINATDSILRVKGPIAAIRSTYQDRGNQSGEDIIIKNILIESRTNGIDGAPAVPFSKGIELTRFTRLCKLDGVSAINLGNGFDISESWSFVMKRCRAKKCLAFGLKAHGVINAIDMSGCHFTENEYGIYVQNAQGGLVAGNTSEYNRRYNFQIGCNGVSVIGNYFEAFHHGRQAQGGSESCVILGTDTKPFVRCLFIGNYVNGGSKDLDGFSGDGVYLYKVFESELCANEFSRSTRFPYHVNNSSEVIGNHFDFSQEALLSEDRDVFIMNTSTRRYGNVGVLSEEQHSNTSVRSGPDTGLENSVKIRPNGMQGSLVENRIYDDGTYDWMFRFGKLTSADEIYHFRAREEAYYDIDNLSISSRVGFYGVTPKHQGEVSGNKAGNTALASLIEELARLGLIRDATT